MMSAETDAGAATGRQQRTPVDLAARLRAVACGDEGALAALYDETRARVGTLVRRLSLDAAGVDDVVLETYMKVWNRASTFDPGRGGALAWILAVARHTALDRRRAGALRERASGGHPQAPDEVSQAPDPGPEPAGAHLAREREERVQSALAQLPEDQRAALELCYWGGHSHAEIAGLLDAPLGTIKTRVRLGLRKLRERLAPLEEQL